MALVARTTEQRRAFVGHRIRWPKDSEPTLQCQQCFEFWPLSLEFWEPSHLRRCRACARARRRDYTRAYMRERRKDPAYRAAERVAKGADYRANADRRRAYQADWYRRKKSTLALALAEQAA